MNVAGSFIILGNESNCIALPIPVNSLIYGENNYIDHHTSEPESSLHKVYTTITLANTLYHSFLFVNTL